ncbi:MAG: TetR/AcrR family transcriptional regulator, partial [Caulobacteraceae bacterium]
MPKLLSPDDIAGFRDRLIDAAERLFAEHGTEVVTIRQIAGELGVSAMTPYRYFRDKDAILAAVRARGFDRHAEALEHAYADHPGDTAGRARAIGAAYVDFALANPETYKLMFDFKQPSEGDYPDLVRAGRRSHATMTLHLRDLARAGQLNGDPELFGHLYWAALHGPLMLQFAGMLPAKYDVRRLIDALSAAIGGAVTRATSPRPAHPRERGDQSVYVSAAGE